MTAFSSEHLFDPTETLDAAALLRRLAACPVGFDATAEHRHGVTIIPKVATVPVALFEALKAYLARAA